MLQEIGKFYPDREITDEFLNELSVLDTNSKRGDKVEHGEEVATYFKSTPDSGGLLKLERMWREHFLETMKPQFLPEHWSTEYNSNRLELRSEEGRLSASDIAGAGLDPLFLQVNRNSSSPPEIQ